MRQRISAPVAALVMALAVTGFLLAFNRANLGPPEKPVQVLPDEPSVDAGQLSAVRSGLLPLGVMAVMPPLVEDRGKGVRVASVMPGSPAAHAGLQAGDLIKSFNGMALAHPQFLVAVLTRVEPKKANEAVIVRDGREQKVVVTGLVPLPPEEQAR